VYFLGKADEERSLDIQRMGSIKKLKIIIIINNQIDTNAGRQTKKFKNTV
jgi:hypothetical protein